MTAQTFSDALGEISEKYIMEAITHEGKPIRRAGHPMRYRVVQAAACVLLAALLSGCAVLAVSPEARAAFVGWIREVSGRYSVYYYFGEEGTGLEGITYHPTWVPNGYEVISEHSDPWNVHIVYQNAGREFAAFNYSMNTEGAKLQVESGDTEVKRTFVNSCPADLYLDPEPGNSNVLIWMNDEVGALFHISAPFNGDEIIKMAESVEAVEITDAAEMNPYSNHG